MSKTYKPLTVADIAAIPEGRAKTSCANHCFAMCTKRDGQWVIEAGWTVPEADEDDFMSFNFHPFKDGRPRPWCGKRMSTLDPAEALRLYEAAKEAVYGSRGDILPGEVIGSVVRE